MRLVAAILLMAIPVNAQAPAAREDPAFSPYNWRLIARGFGNIGRWWNLMSQSDKDGFLDGYQEGMRSAHRHDEIVCEVIRQQIAKSTTTTMDHFSAIAFVCTQQNETSDYDKVKVKDIDGFYVDIANQFIPLAWSMSYLRDKAAGRRSAGQLLDALQAEQKSFSPSPPK